MRRIVAFSDAFCTVGARRDIDKQYFELVVDPDRRINNEDGVELILDRRTARMLALELNRWLKVTAVLS